MVVFNDPALYRSRSPMRTERPEPQLNTPRDEWNEVEKTKLANVTAEGPLGDLVGSFRDLSQQDVAEETEALAKSHGIYLEYDRAKTGKEKDWMYMVRISVAGGGPFTRDTWRVIDDLAEQYTTPSEGGSKSIRLTTRQNIQYHWVRKKDLVPLVRDIAKTGFFALNGCGDNTRNVMGCPLSRHSTLYNAHAAAQKFGKYFELPPESHIKIFEVDTSLTRFDGSRISEPRTEKYEYGPQLLNRKFKIAFSAVHRNPLTGAVEYDNCVELRTNDMGIAPVVENDRVVAFQVYIGGGQGERNGKASASMLGLPVALFTPENLTKGLDSIVKVHEQWGDRKNRHWARLKYVVNSQGIPWYQDQLRAIGATFEQPLPHFDPGPRQMHHGWTTQEDNGKLAYGMYIECGRLIDRSPGTSDARSGGGSTPGNHEHTRALVRHLMDTFDTEVLITPNQDLLFTNLDPAAKSDFEAQFSRFSYGQRNGKPYSKLRLLSGACVGLPTCRLSYSDSEQFEPELIDELEALGFGDLSESIGITGCERQCFRPGTKSLGWVGQGPDMYMLKVGGSEDGRWQGIPLAEDGKLYLRQVPRASVATVCAVLFESYLGNRQAQEDLGAYLRRLGQARILSILRADPRTEALTKKTAVAPYVPENPAALGVV
jgi:sulfite reductase (NADPH) hemoprotein beta-component